MWIITKDYISSAGETTAVGTRSRDLKDGEEDKCTIPFKLYDDDGELYYEGLMSPGAADSMKIFSPLHGWAMGYAGCTEIHVPDSSGEFRRV